MPKRSQSGAGDCADARPSRLYANHLSIDFSLSEVELGFGQCFGSSGVPQTQSWLVTSPVHLVTFGRAIEETIARYEKRYGRIPGGCELNPTGMRQ